MCEERLAIRDNDPHEELVYVEDPLCFIASYRTTFVVIRVTVRAAGNDYSQAETENLSVIGTSRVPRSSIRYMGEAQVDIARYHGVCSVNTW